MKIYTSIEREKKKRQKFLTKKIFEINFMKTQDSLKKENKSFDNFFNIFSYLKGSRLEFLFFEELNIFVKKYNILKLTKKMVEIFFLYFSKFYFLTKFFIKN